MERMILLNLSFEKQQKARNGLLFVIFFPNHLPFLEKL